MKPYLKYLDTFGYYVSCAAFALSFFVLKDVLALTFFGFMMVIYKMDRSKNGN